MGVFSKLRGRVPEDRGIEAEDGEATGRRIDLRSIALGLKAGLFGTVVMTVFRMPIADSLPPTAAFYAKFVGSGPAEDYPIEGLVLHLIYGMAGGGLYGALPIVDGSGSEADNERRATLAGAAYGLALSVFGDRLILRGVLGMDPKRDERFIFHVGHVIYGLALGALFGSRISHRDGD